MDYKNHILFDCISGLSICKSTSIANSSGSTVILYIITKTNLFLSVQECSFIANKAYNCECIITLNAQNSKSLKKLPVSYLFCEADVSMHIYPLSIAVIAVVTKESIYYRSVKSNKEICLTHNKPYFFRLTVRLV